MGAAVGAVLTLAVGVAVSPVPVIAVILMLFSPRARVNGPVFLAGWALALAAVFSVAYLVADAGDVATDSTASDTASWGKVAFGAVLLVLALRRWRSRPGPGEEAPMPKWMTGIDAVTPVRAFVLGVGLAGVNPKNLLLTVAAAAGLAQLAPTTSQAVVAIVVFVVVGSITIAGPVLYRLAGGDRAAGSLEGLKAWLGVHNAAVMAVLLLVFGVDLIAKGLPALGG